MDRYFYSIEFDGNQKIVHILGNIYYNDGDETEKQHRELWWVGMFLSLDELYNFIENDDLYEYINERVVYLNDVTETEAVEICQSYFNGKPGTQLHIKNVNENTPCGDYWFE